MPRHVHPKLLSRIRPAVVVTQGDSTPSGASFLLAWDPDANNETGYLAEKSTDNATWVTVATLTANSNNCAVVGLTYNSPFYFRVAAFNGAGSEAPTSIGPTYTPYGAALASPAITLVDPNTISFSGTAPSGAPANGGYLVQYHKSGEPAFEQEATSPTLPVSISGLLPDNTYYARCYIYNDNYDGSRSLSPVSATVSATTLGYAGLVESYNPFFYAKLNELEGVIALNEAGADGEYAPNDSTVWQYGALGQTGALIDNPTTAARFQRANNATADFGNLTEFNALTQFTFAAWIKPVAFADNYYATLIGKAASGTDALSICLGGSGLGNSTRIAVLFRNGGECFCYSDTDRILDPALWYFVVVRFDGSGATNADKVKISVNTVGESITFPYTIPSVTTSNSSPVRVGYSLDAYLDEVAMFPAILTSGQELTLYNASGRAL